MREVVSAYPLFGTFALLMGKKRLRGTTHKHNEEKEIQRDQIRKRVASEESNRNCQCPPWAPHLSQCPLNGLVQDTTLISTLEKVERRVAERSEQSEANTSSGVSKDETKKATARVTDSQVVVFAPVLLLKYLIALDVSSPTPGASRRLITLGRVFASRLFRWSRA